MSGSRTSVAACDGGARDCECASGDEVGRRGCGKSRGSRKPSLPAAQRCWLWLEPGSVVVRRSTSGSLPPGVGYQETAPSASRPHRPVVGALRSGGRQCLLSAERNHHSRPVAATTAARKGAADVDVGDPRCIIAQDDRAFRRPHGHPFASHSGLDTCGQFRTRRALSCCTGRLFGPCIARVSVSSSAVEMLIGCFMTSHNTPSEQGGVVSEPLYSK